MSQNDAGKISCISLVQELSHRHTHVDTTENNTTFTMLSLYRC